MIGSRARRIGLGLLPNKPLADAETFDYGFVLELSEHVPLRIDARSHFFHQLYEVLVTHLVRGSSISGSWGRLALQQGQIVFDLGVAARSRGEFRMDREEAKAGGPQSQSAYPA